MSSATSCCKIAPRWEPAAQALEGIWAAAFCSLPSLPWPRFGSSSRSSPSLETSHLVSQRSQAPSQEHLPWSAQNLGPQAAVTRFSAQTRYSPPNSRPTPRVQPKRRAPASPLGPLRGQFRRSSQDARAIYFHAFDQVLFHHYKTQSPRRSKNLPGRSSANGGFRRRLRRAQGLPAHHLRIPAQFRRIFTRLPDEGLEAGLGRHRSGTQRPCRAAIRVLQLRIDAG